MKDLKYYFSYIVDKMHTTVMATMDEDINPVTCAIDIMDYDENSLYFLTAKGKSFYDRLIKNNNIAFTGIHGKDTMSTTAISIKGKAKEIGNSKLSELFDKNPYMNDIYPDKNSRSILTVFKIYEGTGEWFKIDKKNIESKSFCFGNTKIKDSNFTFQITNNCTNCKICLDYCPRKCINIHTKPFIIIKESCIRCGNCIDVCPNNAIIKS